MYYEEHLAIKKRSDFSTLKGCLVTEIIVDKKGFFRVYIDHQAKLKKNFGSFVLI